VEAPDFSPGKKRLKTKNRGFSPGKRFSPLILPAQTKEGSAVEGSLFSLPRRRAVAYRCPHPGQQQGRRIPSFSCEHTLATCCLLVSGFFTEIVQQIHSLRASGVISSHFSRAARSAISALRKSAGTLCTTPLAILFLLTR